ncbi:alkaline phosphatase family protein [Bifidobacterium gallicum]|uniref:Arylsulfatase n=1 Tax=Bifidobacterium gallicum DSM 20093 = LMG 11596 TaxID=561180 RepID=D1NUQ1_9BIFI|nr:alkaline phosphatase family protein [Bifidobacterium gallicum]EFA22552.1 arylsulfatase [Bifidobacterium gallicum DSM 20093 = LMG 11596]KFI59541.1 arylsulfatase [Bifidobacterium gallicum DSM 20093 = LMG 11596]
MQHQPTESNTSHESSGRRAAQSQSQGASARRQRRPFPGWLYALLFIVVDLITVGIVQWGVSAAASNASLDRVTLWDMIAKMGNGNMVFLFNIIVVALIYLVLLMVTNRFWIATPILLSLAIVLAVVERIKIEVRTEPLMPSDLSFLKSDTGSIMSFLPPGSGLMIGIAIALIAVIIAGAIALSIIDGRHGSMVRGRTKRTNALAAITRIVLTILPLGALYGYAMQVGTVDSWAYHVSRGMGDTPSMWDAVYDAQRNGPVISFLRQINPKVMDEPQGYSEQTMRDVAARYSNVATEINKNRVANLNDSTVIYVLSESFSDPTRVPGVQLNADPMPQIRALKGETTSGLMLSSGYGGGTANLEYMGLTGMSMCNFDASLTSPYQQLVPGASWVPSVNQLWGKPVDSIGLHPYEASMYSRAQNYKKMGFSHFYTLSGENGKDIIAHQNKIDHSPYVSDEAAYQSTIEQVKDVKGGQFIQLITMQNHMPYNNWYNNNTFKATNTPGSAQLPASERESIETYAKGMQLTDDATIEFLKQLDSIDKPITVVFYGDHLPGIYKTAGADEKNSIDLHLTDYFIWSNKASEVNGKPIQGTKLDDAAYTSPNYFIAQVAAQTDAKVSPYLAFLTRMHAHIAAMEPPVVNKIQGWDRIPEGQAIYLNAQGEPMSVADMSKSTQDMLHDYQLIQYDITAGNHYLRDTDFMTLPR